MSQSATPATRNKAMQCLKPPKVAQNLPICMAIRPSRGHWRQVANGCERLQTVADDCGRKRNIKQTHPQRPDPRAQACPGSPAVRRKLPRVQRCPWNLGHETGCCSTTVIQSGCSNLGHFTHLEKVSCNAQSKFEKTKGYSKKMGK